MFSVLKAKTRDTQAVNLFQVETERNVSLWKRSFEEGLLECLKYLETNNKETIFTMKYSLDMWSKYHASVLSKDRMASVFPADEVQLLSMFRLLEVHSLHFLSNAFECSASIDENILPILIKEWEWLVKTLVTCLMMAPSETTSTKLLTESVHPASFSWKHVVERLPHSQAVEGHLGFFFRKLQCRLLQRICHTLPDPRSAVSSLATRSNSIGRSSSSHSTDCPYHSVGLDLNLLRDGVVYTLNTQSQLAILDQGLMDVLSSCATEKYHLERGSVITRTGEKLLTLVKHLLSFEQLQKPLFLEGHLSYAVADSIKSSLAMVISWYRQNITSNIVKWSVQPLLTLAYQDCTELLNCLKENNNSCSAPHGPSPEQQDVADYRREMLDLRLNILALQEDTIGMCHQHLVTKCAAILDESYPSVKQWKAVKPHAEVSLSQTSPYMEDVIRKFFRPLIDVLQGIPKDLQTALLLWHCFIFCREFMNRVTQYRKCYSQPAGVRLHADLGNLQEWIAKAVDSLVDSKVKDATLSSVPFEYISLGLNILCGRSSAFNYIYPPQSIPQEDSASHFTLSIYKLEIFSKDALAVYSSLPGKEWQACTR